MPLRDGISSNVWGDGTRPSVSVIIPTYNRFSSLLRTLASIADQTYPPGCFEVVVVDDGGNDGTQDIQHRDYPFPLQYVRQDNQGATSARNHGAAQSRGDLLFFVDDDIRLYPNTLECMVTKLGAPSTIVLGTLVTPPEILKTSCFARSQGSAPAATSVGTTQETVPFQHCATGLLAIHREDLIALGGFRDPSGGWPNWDDVDFGYRANQNGYRLIRATEAIAEHWDYALGSLESACSRWYRAGHSGAALLQRYPELANHIPMLLDKRPVRWRQDPLTLILRKVARRIVSSRVIVWAMEAAAPVLQQRLPNSTALRLLYRWIISGYIYRGYCAGLRALASAEEAL